MRAARGVATGAVLAAIAVVASLATHPRALKVAWDRHVIRACTPGDDDDPAGKAAEELMGLDAREAAADLAAALHRCLDLRPIPSHYDQVVLELFEALVRVDPTSAADELPRILAHVEGAWPERVQLRQARIRVLGDARHLHDAGALDARGEALYLAAWLDTVAGAFELELASHASSGAFCLALLARDLANAAPPWRIEVLPGTGALVLDGGVEVPDPRDQIGERFPCDAGGCPLALARGSKTVAFAATIGVLDRKSGVELARRRVTTQAEPVPPSATAR